MTTTFARLLEGSGPATHLATTRSAWIRSRSVSRSSLCFGVRTCCRRIPTCGVRFLRRKNGGFVVTIDPIRTRTAAASDSHLAPIPGTDAALAMGLMHVVLAQGKED